ncbi:uncharacterized protein LOC123014415 [Tribolium madens]|uniref:uncharacterized protein LOC123014415 n=1 Tax=Tribolium madens TaxID=41895 RepID=UPI001CF725B1|nr:uncharacterized protein LOC123014415 [Tribolium madens]XP_044269462.1 uncharacterized protein LOC123014415 [Tribolium madens]
MGRSRKKSNKVTTEASKPQNEPEKDEFGLRNRNTREFSNSNRRSSFNFKKEDERKSEPFKRSKHDFEDQNRRHTHNATYGRRSNSFGNSEFAEYNHEFRSHRGPIENLKTKEIVSNLFEMPDDYSLAHCVAEDMNMGSGIAVQFRRDFKRVDELLNQHQEPGGLAVLEHDGRYIYYLVTKRLSSGKPTYGTLFSSLQKLRTHMVHNNVRKLAIPRIGCGLDRLQWDNVKFMLEFIFKEIDVEIVVCNLEPKEDSPQQKHKNCKVTHETYPIKDIESGTVILYFSSEDEFITDEMRSLDEKFNFLNEFKFGRKSLGSVIFTTKTTDYLLCGCIVRRRKNDSFDFQAFQKCLQAIQRENRKHKYYYYAFQAFEDKDSTLNQKIINLMRNSLRDIEVYVCWVGDLQKEIQLNSSFNSSFGKNDSDWRSRDSNIEENSSFVEETKDDAKSVDYWDQDVSEVPPRRESEAIAEPLRVTHDTIQQEEQTNHEYDSFRKALETKSIQLLIQDQNTTVLPKREFSRVCFAREDLIIHSGVAGPGIGPHVGKLLNQNGKEGDLIWTKDGNNYLYCLIVNWDTKPQTIFSTIQKLQNQVTQHKVSTLVLPKLESDVKFMFQYVFGRLKIIIAPFETSCDFPTLKKTNGIRIQHVRSPLHHMKKKSVILYLASVDGQFTKEMDGLKGKFDFVEGFKQKNNTLGSIVYYKQNEDNILYGCIVKKSFKDSIDFEAFQKCLTQVNENKKKDNMKLVGIQATSDNSINYKIVTLMLHTLQNVTINICWPGALKEIMIPDL